MKIAVVGSINMDMIIRAERIPLKGETISGNQIEYQPGGKGANQAVAIAKLGGQVTMFGCVGKDAVGEQLIQNMKDCGVNTAYVRSLNQVPTGQAVIIVGEGDNTIIVIGGANNCVDVAYVEAHKEEILQSDIIVLQNEIPQEVVAYTIRMGYAHGKKIIWNPAPARKLADELLEKITYLTPNEHEVLIIWEDQGETLQDLMKRYPQKLIVTQGEKGVGICHKEQGIMTIPAMNVKVKDTTGAGDTLNGAFCVGLSKGMDEIAALRFANAAAGLSVQRYGAQKGMPDYEEVQRALQNI
jgi:ribokinase